MSMVFNLSQIIQQSANNFPDKIAYHSGANTGISFRELEERSNQLAHLLLAEGIQKGDRVGIYLNRCIESVIAVYGVLKAGAAFVPLASHTPVVQLVEQIAFVETSILITGPALKHQLRKLLAAQPTGLQTIVGIEAEGYSSYPWSVLVGQSSASPNVPILSDDLAYIMYTSGSTGQPKGIMHTHSSGLSYARLSADLYTLHSEDVVANHCALHYDISTFGYFSAPLVGATTFLLTDAQVNFPASAIPALAEAGLTVWYSVPLAVVQMLKTGLLAKHPFTKLRYLLTGGEPFAPSHIRQLMQLWPQAVFSNVYGPAEVNQCTYYNFDTLPASADAVPLGYFWCDATGLVVDENDKEVSTGEIGELLVRSSTRMQGYWRRPDLTAKAFYRQTTIDDVEHIYYRTGDLVYYNADGQLMFMGRKDRQIKTRGYRVELTAVEQAINALDAISEAAVYPTRNGEEGWLIEAVAISAGREEVSSASLRQALAQDLPAYALPQHIYLVAEIPRTAAGKLDHQAIKTLKQ